MDFVMGLVMLASSIVLIFGLGQVIGSEGEEYRIALVSGIMVIACGIWAWGYFCGMPSTEDDEEDGK